MMKKLCMFCWALVLCSLLVRPLFGETVIRNLKVQQRWPWNGLVDITYSVESTVKNFDGSPAEVTLTFAGYDRDQNRPVALKSLSGDGVGQPVKAGVSCRTVWNAALDYPDFNSSAFQLSLQARAKASRRQEVPKEGRYLVIDLSGGPLSDAYPWRYTDQEPDVGGDECRSSFLWLRRIPAGTFIMGAPKEELGRGDNETQHQVTLTRPFFMGIFEVTQKQWELVMGTRPAKYPGWDRPVEQVSYDDIRGREKTDGAGWPAKGHAVDGDSFLGRLRMKTGGLVLDLPTEAQWEYACRAGTSTALNSGKNLTDGSQCPNLDEVARNAKNQQDGKGGYQGAHARTGCYRPNNWGLYDMHGNVFEWCLDWQAYDLGAEPVTDPVGPASGMADPGQDSGARPEASRPGRVIRGGLFWGHPGICRSACRGMYGAKPFARSSFAGFRLVCVE